MEEIMHFIVAIFSIRGDHFTKYNGIPHRGAYSARAKITWETKIKDWIVNTPYNSEARAETVRTVKKRTRANTGRIYFCLSIPADT